MLSVFLLICVAFINSAVSSRCRIKDFGSKKIVCVCNEEYCDSLDAVPKSLPEGSALVYESSQNGKRMEQDSLLYQKNGDTAETVIHVNVNTRYQGILGFGGSFTDSSGINMAALSTKLQENIMQDYYGSSGLEYDMGRVPMASCDFSTREYSYSDYPGDFTLRNFSLAEEDIKYKIPFLHRAQQLTQSRGRRLRLFASPWGPPAWMKTNEKMNGKGTLKGDVGGPYYQTWADYFVKFLQEYEKHNISYWGLTAENEPLNGFVEAFPFQCLGFTAETQRDFIKMNLGPTLKKSGFGVDKIKLMIMDDQRFNIPKWPVTVLSDVDAAQYVSGIAVHWYGNVLAPARLLNDVHEKLPSYFVLATEACEGSYPWTKGVDLGSWDRAETYAFDVMENLLHWTVGWVDWNLVLDLQGGPNWVENFVDAPIIVNANENEYYKQPMYYALAHFSKFIPPGSVRVDVEMKSNPKKLDVAAFQAPDGATVLVVLNREKQDTKLTISDNRIGFLTHPVPARSIQSYVWYE